jgi:hypothetical protein
VTRPLTAFELLFSYERHLSGSHYSGTVVQRSHGRPCPFCGVIMGKAYQTNPTRDHVLPRSRGGDLTAGNRLVICRRCNGDKDNMTLLEFVGFLKERKDPRAGRVAQMILDIMSAVPTSLAKRLIGTDAPKPGEPLGERKCVVAR